MQNAATLINPLGLDIIDASGFAAYHDVTNLEKAETIAADMKARGWQGAPLVVLRDYSQALTGVHRLAAAQAAGLASVPGVDAEELLNAYGIDLWERRDDYENLADALAALLAELPADVRTAYGIDLH